MGNEASPRLLIIYVCGRCNWETTSTVGPESRPPIMIRCPVCTKAGRNAFQMPITCRRPTSKQMEAMRELPNLPEAERGRKALELIKGFPEVAREEVPWAFELEELAHPWEDKKRSASEAEAQAARERFNEAVRDCIDFLFTFVIASGSDLRSSQNDAEENPRALVWAFAGDQFQIREARNAIDRLRLRWKRQGKGGDNTVKMHVNREGRVEPPRPGF